MKNVYKSIYLLIIILTFYSCADNNLTINTKTTTKNIINDIDYSTVLNDAIESIKIVDNNGIISSDYFNDEIVYGGSEIEKFIFDYDTRFYAISSAFSNYVSEKEFNEWQSEVNKIGYEIPILNNFRMVPDFNIKNFIKYFNIDKEKLKSILGTEYEPNGDNWATLNNIEIEALYSDDPKELFNAFPGDYAFFNNGRSYAPIWLMSHTPEEYIEEGIPPEVIEKTLLKWETDKVFESKLIESVRNKNITYKKALEEHSKASASITTAATK